MNQQNAFVGATKITVTVQTKDGMEITYNLGDGRRELGLELAVNTEFGGGWNSGFATGREFNLRVRY